MTTKCGDVVRVLFPNSNLRTAKRRPALVLRADNLNTGLAQTVVAMITGNLVRGGHRSCVTIRVSLTEGIAVGLRTDSVIMTDNVATVFETKIDSVLGRLSDLSEVDTALKHALALP